MVVKNLETYLRKRMGSRLTLSGKDSQFEGILPLGEHYSPSMNNLDEVKFLARVINYYLSDLGLGRITDGEYNLYYLASLGDAYVLVEVVKRLGRTNKEKYAPYLANKKMKTALVQLGFLELYDAPEHHTGTLFEVIFACAVLQGNEVVVTALLDSLLGGGFAFSTPSLPTFGK